MSRSKKNIPLWAKTGHQKPVTRREFLASGLIPFSAWVIGPSLTTLLRSPQAFAQDACAAGVGTQYIPFITLNLSGGPGLASQVVVKTLTGDYLSSYTKLGLGAGPNRSFNIVREFGNVEFAGTAIGGNTQGLVSKFLTGVRNPRNENNFRVSALDQSAFIWTAVELGDDTANNPLDVSGLVIKMGLTGEKLPNLGRTASATGINQKAAVLPPPAPYLVGSVNDLANALNYSAALTRLSSKQKSSLARLIASLTGSQVRKIANMNGAQTTAQLIECAGIRNTELISTGGGDINPLTVGGTVTSELTRIWDINANDRTSQDAVFACMVYNGLVGNASTINLNMGGYDYHDGTRATGDGRDQDAGAVVGKILETAKFLNKPVFVYICADGATTSTETATADSAWRSDRGIAGMQYMIAFHPNGRPNVSSNQIGGFNNGQAADGKFPTGTSAELAAQAVFANYAAWNGRMDFLEQYRILNDSALRSQAIKLQKG